MTKLEYISKMAFALDLKPRAGETWDELGERLLATARSLRAENAELVRQTGSCATAFPTDRGDAGVSRGLTKLEWMAGMVESGGAAYRCSAHGQEYYNRLDVPDVVDRAAAILEECRRREGGAQ